MIKYETHTHTYITDLYSDVDLFACCRFGGAGLVC